MATTIAPATRTDATDPKDRPVVVGIDGGKHDDATIETGAQLASGMSRPLVVAHCDSFASSAAGMYTEAGWIDQGHLEQELERRRHEAELLVGEHVARTRADHPTLTVHGTVMHDSAIHGLVELSEHADLVVIGSDRVSAGRALLLNSTTHVVAHHAHCPVMLVPESDPTPVYDSVTVGVDGSDNANAALDWATDHAALRSLPLSIVHAWEYPYLGARTGIAEPRELMEVDAAQVLADAVHRASSRAPDLTIRPFLREQHPVLALAGDSTASNLLVVGARGRGLFAAVVLGSTSSALIHEANGPLAIVRAASAPGA